MPSFRHVVPRLIHTSTTTEQEGCVCFLGPHYCLHQLSSNCQQNQLPTQFACYSATHIQASVASWLKQHLLFESEVCYCTNIFNGCCSTERCTWYNPVPRSLVKLQGVYSQPFHVSCLGAWELPCLAWLIAEFSDVVLSCFTLSGSTVFTDMSLV